MGRYFASRQSLDRAWKAPPKVIGMIGPRGKGEPNKSEGYAIETNKTITGFSVI